MSRPVRLGVSGVFLAAGFLAPPAHADEAAPAAPSIALLTMGPGDHPFSKFGHVAIVVRDPVRGRDDVFNYGTFTFDSPWLIVDFLKGKLRYWLSVDTLAHTVAVYRRQGRSMLLQELAIAPDESEKLAAFLWDNARDENKYYRYDYYLDNCSTRIRDALDKAVSGRMRTASQGAARLTFRGHTLRLVAGDFPLYAALDIVMGPLIDQPITQWDEAFLPEELAQVARQVRVPAPGGEAPLVARELVLSTSERPERSSPPQWTWRFAAVGGAGGAAAWLAARFANRRAGQVLLAVTEGILGITCGFLGTVFMLLWALTDHRVAYRNENILLCAPIAFGLTIVAVGFARGREGPTRWALRVALALALLATLDLLLKIVLPGGGQDNGRWVAFFVPLWWGITLANWMAWRRSASKAV